MEIKWLKNVITLQSMKSLFTRIVFICHGFTSLYILYFNGGNTKLWSLMLPLSLLLIEAIYTIGYRKGRECKYFWLSGFLYILTIVPIIWIIELELVDEKLNTKHSVNIKLTLSNTTSQPELQESNAFFKAISLSNDLVRKKVCEIGIIIGLIGGRWLMPRGDLTRDQLSTLLLGYVSTAADILELFQTFEEPAIIFRKSVTVAVLAIYTWSILQFTVIATVTVKDEEEKSSINEDIEETGDTSTSAKKTRTLSVSAALIHQKVHGKVLNSEVFQVLVPLLMHDGPFLILRSFLIIKFSILSELYIFFLVKNAIVTVLQVYRLVILMCLEEEEQVDLNYNEDNASYNENDVEVAQPQEETLEQLEADIEWSSVESADNIINAQVNNASRSACNSIDEDDDVDIDQSRGDARDNPENVPDSSASEKMTCPINGKE